MTRGVCVHLVPLIAFQVTGLEQAGTEAHRVFVRLLRVLDVEVHVQLLRRAIWPFGRNVLWRKLNADPPLTGCIDDAVECLVVKDVPSSIAAQNALSACRSAASNTTTVRIGFMKVFLRSVRSVSSEGADT